MSYTMVQYVTEVQNRLRRYPQASMIDATSLERFINDARHIVQMATLQMVPERYARLWVPSVAPTESSEHSVRASVYAGGGVTTVLNRAFLYDLPADFIGIVDVSYVDAQGDFWPARRSSTRELYTTMTRSWTMPTERDPIYVLDRQTSASTYRLIVSAGDSALVADDIEVWYLAKLPSMQIVTSNVGGTDAEVRIGYDLQDIVISIAMLRTLQAAGDPTVGQIIEQDVMAAVKAFESNYKGAVDRKLLLTQAREGLIPNTPIVEA